MENLLAVQKHYSSEKGQQQMPKAASRFKPDLEAKQTHFYRSIFSQNLHCSSRPNHSDEKINPPTKMARQIAKVKQPLVAQKKKGKCSNTRLVHKQNRRHDMHPNLRQPEHKLQAMTFYYD